MIRCSLADDHHGVDRVVRDHHDGHRDGHHDVGRAKVHRYAAVHHGDHHDEDHVKDLRCVGHHDRRGVDRDHHDGRHDGRLGDHRDVGHTQVRHCAGRDHRGDHHGVDHVMVHHCVGHHDRRGVDHVKDHHCGDPHDRRDAHGRMNSRSLVVGVRHRIHGVGREVVRRGVGREADHPDEVRRDVGLAYRRGHHVGCDQIVIRLLEAGDHRRLCVDYSYV